MRILLDTHIFVWAVSGDRKLTKATQQLIQDAEEVFVSAASIWEISIKAALDRIEAVVDALVAEIAAAGFREPLVTTMHATCRTPLAGSSSGPFDRLLIARAITEPLRLLTVDERVRKYSELVIRL